MFAVLPSRARLTIFRSQRRYLSGLNASMLGGTRGRHAWRVSGCLSDMVNKNRVITIWSREERAKILERPTQVVLPYPGCHFGLWNSTTRSSSTFRTLKCTKIRVESLQVHLRILYTHMYTRKESYAVFKISTIGSQGDQSSIRNSEEAQLSGQHSTDCFSQRTCMNIGRTEF